MKLKTLYDEIIEANLMGNSRSGSDTNWNYYIVRNFDKNKTYNIEKNDELVDGSFNKIGEVKKGDIIQILTPELLLKGKSAYAKVKIVKNNLEGYLHIRNIQKPSNKVKSEDSVIGGGTESKEFTPTKLGLDGVKFSSVGAAVSRVQTSLKSVYGGDIYKGIRMYLYDCINTTVGSSLNESFTKNYSLRGTHNVSNSDIKILSKNFGEVLAMLYILANNKKTKYVEFPTDASQGLYDFIMVEKDGITNYYSVKSYKGSSTSLANVNYVLKHFGSTNSVLQTYKDEVDVIKTLFNNKKEGITTINNIVNFFDTHLKSKYNNIIRELNKISKVRLNSLNQSDLDMWFKSMINTVDKETFVSKLNHIYNTILNDAGGTPKSTIKTLEEIYESGNGSKSKHGYIIYPMGSYITNYLNLTGNYKNVLNVILNYASFIHQFTVSLYPESLQISISSFKKTSFKFDYNAGSKYPGNRPIGFIKQ
jgi:ribosome recycling factor